MASALEDVTKPGMFWTKNRISILIPWLTPLLLSISVGFLNVPLAFISYLVLSLVAQAVIVKRSPFSETCREDFEQLLSEKEITLADGTVVSADDIKKTRISFRRFRIISFLACFVLGIPFKTLPDFLLGWLLISIWFILSQALCKTYLIAKDLPLNGFPFFRSNNNTRNVTHWSDRKISTGVMDNPMNPSHPCNIGNPANPNYIFK